MPVTQVLRKEEADDRWRAVPRETLELVRSSLDGNESTHIRVEVDHFTLFSCCYKANLSIALPVKDYSNERAVGVNNRCGEDLFVVVFPSTFTESESNTVRYGVSATVAGQGGGVNFERGNHTAMRPLTHASVPNYTTIRPDSSENFDLDSRGQNIIVLLCTVDGLSPRQPPSLEPQPSGEPYTESKNDFAGHPSDRRDHDARQIVKYWGYTKTYGGRQIDVTPTYFEAKNPRVMEMGSDVIEQDRCKLVMEKAGFVYPSAPEPMQASASQTSSAGRRSSLTSRLKAMIGWKTEKQGE